MKLTFSFLLAVAAWAADPFLQPPYLQLGLDATDPTKMSLMWHAADVPAKFAVRVKPVGTDAWVPHASLTERRIAVRTIEPHKVYTAQLHGLKPGVEFDYEVLLDGRAVFAARGLARKNQTQAYKFVVFGDCGQNNTPQKMIAAQVQKLAPDFIQVTGDIVYSRGRISEYREKFYPIYNTDQLPMLRTRPMIGVPGNHDTSTTDLTKYPDAQAYYYYWNQPLNGPNVEAMGQGRKFEGDPADIKAVLSSAGDVMKQMGSYSFAYGNSYWIAIDSSTYLDWTQTNMRAWVEQELKKSQDYTWRFVTMHHPAFNSSRAHFKEQHIRWMADLFEKYKVDLVLAGHVHNYQRTYPLSFKMAANQPPRGLVDGKFEYDKEFDGVKKTKPKWPLYLVTGAGGAGLYDGDQEDSQASWQRFTLKFVAKVNSFSYFEVDGKTLKFKQIDGRGREIDALTITK